MVVFNYIFGGSRLLVQSYPKKALLVMMFLKRKKLLNKFTEDLVNMGKTEAQLIVAAILDRSSTYPTTYTATGCAMYVSNPKYETSRD